MSGFLLKTNILFFIVLSILTIVSHAIVNRYEKSGPQLLTDHWVAGQSEKRRADIGKDALTLFSGDPKAGIDVYQNLSSVPHGSILRLSADIKCDDVQPGERAWNRARLLLVQNDGQKNRWDLPHKVASLAGTLDWKNYHDIFTIAPKTKKIRVVAQLSQSMGSLKLRNIRLYPVSQTRIFTWASYGILFSWGVFFLILFGSCFFMGRETVILRILLVFGFVAILIGTTMPMEMKNQMCNEIITQFHTEIQTVKSIVPWDPTKIGHFCFFALFGTALSLMAAKESVIPAMTAVLLLAGGTEIVQFFIDGRTPLFNDFLIDTVGGFSGMTLIRLAGSKKYRTDFKSNKGKIQ